jgi:protein-L-isoaspartate O-methyltransferase
VTETDPWAKGRAEMVAHDLAGRGIRDARVLEAMGDVPREAFLPVGGRRHQRLVRVRRRGEDRIEEDLGGVTFVPLVGDEGW